MKYVQSGINSQGGMTYVESNRDEHKNVARANAGSRAARRGGSLDEHLDLEHNHVHIVGCGVVRCQPVCMHMSIKHEGHL